MKIKIKSIIVIGIIFSSILIAGWNLNFSAKNLNCEMNNSLTSRSNNHHRDVNYYWGVIEIISEPIPNSNINIEPSRYSSIAVENEYIYIVWHDTNNTNGASTDDCDIFYKYFNGTSWSPVEVISEPIPGMNINIGASRFPSIGVEDGNVYVAWSDNSFNGSGLDTDIFYRYFNGSIWSDIESLSEPISGYDINIGHSYFPAIAVENGNVYIVWSDGNNTNGSGFDNDIFYRYFNGTSWSELEILSEPIEGANINAGSSSDSVIAVENGNVYVIWEDSNNTNGAGNDGDVFYRHFDGSKWSDVEVISEPIPGSNTNTGYGGVWSNDIAVENGNVYVVWADWNNTNGAGTDYDIFYRYYYGTSWSNIEVISEPIPGADTNNKNSMRSALAVDDDKIYVVWEDNNSVQGGGTDYDIFFRQYNGTSWSNIEVISEPLQGFNINTGDSISPAMAVENGTVYVTWEDNTTMNGAGTDYDIFFRRTYTQPVLSSGIVTPSSGYTYTHFNYSVNYLDKINKSPVYVNISIDGINYTMQEVDPNDIDYEDGKDYFFNISLNISTNHTFQFFASPDGYFIISTKIIDAPDVFNSPPIIGSD